LFIRRYFSLDPFFAMLALFGLSCVKKLFFGWDCESFPPGLAITDSPPFFSPANCSFSFFIPNSNPPLFSMFQLIGRGEWLRYALTRERLFRPLPTRLIGVFFFFRFRFFGGPFAVCRSRPFLVLAFRFFCVRRCSHPLPYPLDYQNVSISSLFVFALGRFSRTHSVFPSYEGKRLGCLASPFSKKGASIRLLASFSFSLLRCCCCSLFLLRTYCLSFPIFFASSFQFLARFSPFLFFPPLLSLKDRWWGGCALAAPLSPFCVFSSFQNL